MKAPDNRAPIRWSGEEERIVIENYGKLTYSQIASLLKTRTWLAVRHRAAFLGLTQSSNLGRRYCADTGFFATPTVLNSYWAGFLAADGNVAGNRLSIGLAHKDKTHVEKLRRALRYTGPIYKGRTVCLQITCATIVQDLKRNFSITERKSLTLEPPSLTNEDTIRAFIVGVIDGDGSITVEEKNGKYRHLRITIYGTQMLLHWIRQQFDRWVPMSERRVCAEVHKRPAGNLYSYRVTAQRAAKIAALLCSVPVPRLKRKWDKVQTLNTERKP